MKVIVIKPDGHESDEYDAVMNVSANPGDGFLTIDYGVNGKGLTYFTKQYGSGQWRGCLIDPTAPKRYERPDHKVEP